jgi:membrane-associated phospholipid phosphatase
MVLTALGALTPDAGYSQSIPSMLAADLGYVAGDAWDVWTSPLRGRRRDWLTAAGVVGLAAAVSPLDDNVDRWATAHRNDRAYDFLDPVRTGGAAFTGKTITPVALGLLVVSLATKNTTLQEGLFGCVTAYGASSLVRTFVVYPLVARTRPDPRSPDGPPPPAKEGDQYHFAFPGKSAWGEHSMPGGHLANIAACSEFLTSRYSMGVVEPAIWALVGGVALGRTLDRGHWVSDEVVGAAFGYAVGRQVALRSRRREAKDSPRTEADGFQPFVSPSGGRITFGFAHVF